MNPSSLYEWLDALCVKVEVLKPLTNGVIRTKRRYRYFAQHQKITLPEGEIQISVNNKVGRSIFSSEIIQLLEKNLHYMYTKKKLKDIIYDVEANKDKVKNILEEQFPKYELKDIKGETYVYYKNYSNELKFTGSHTAIKKEIVSYLENNKDGLSALKISELYGISLSGCSRIMKEILQENSNITIVTKATKGRRAERWLIHNNFIKELPGIFKKLPIRIQNCLIKYNITKEVLISIIQQNPYLNSSKFNSILKDLYGRDFKSPIANILRVFTEQGLIMNAGSLRSPKYHLVDEQHRVCLTNTGINIIKLVNFVREHQGCTVKELYYEVRPLISVEGFYFKLYKIRELEVSKVFNEGDKRGIYRCYTSDYKKGNNEVSFDELGF